MGWVTIARPGTFTGPCAEPCAHTDCAITRRWAESLCTICQKPIGYDAPNYSDGADGHVHAYCAWDQEEQRRKAAAS